MSGSVSVIGLLLLLFVQLAFGVLASFSPVPDTKAPRAGGAPNGLSRVLTRTVGSTTTRYVWGLGLLYEVNGSTVKYYHADQVGSTVALTDGTGAVTDRVDYAPFGEVVARSGSSATPFLYNGDAGVETDASGLLYMRSRYYQPRLMRFINADPIRFEGGMNWYAFAGNNPLGLLDPNGTECVRAQISQGIIDYGNSIAHSNENDDLWGKVNMRFAQLGGPGLDRALNLTMVGLTAVPRRIQQASLQSEIEEAGPDGVIDPLRAQMRANAILMAASTALSPSSFAAESLPTSLSPNSINFSQRTVSSNVAQYADDMVAGRWDWSRSGPLRVMEKEGGGWVSYDNRRLLAAQQAGLESVPVQVVRGGDMMSPSRTWAEAFTRRFNDPRNVPAVPAGGLPTQPTIAAPR